MKSGKVAEASVPAGPIMAGPIDPELQPPGIVDQQDWYIDPASGDDHKSGRTPERALQTHEELRRRIGPDVGQDVVVYLLNDFGPDNPIVIEFTLGPDVTMRYVGRQPTAEATVTIIHAEPINPAGNEGLKLTTNLTGGSGWAPYINTSGSPMRRLRFESQDGPALAFACHGFGDGVTVRTSMFGMDATTPEVPTKRMRPPGSGVNITVETGFVRIDSLLVDVRVSPKAIPGQLRLLFVDLELSPDNRHSVRAAGVGVNGIPIVGFTGCSVGALSVQHAGKVAFDFCRLGGDGLHVAGALVHLAGCCCVGNILVLEGARVAVYAHTIFQDSSLRVCGFAKLGTAGFFGSPEHAGLGGPQHAEAGLVIEERGAARVEPVLPVHWGAGQAVYGMYAGGHGVKVKAGGLLTYRDPSGTSPAKGGITVTGDQGDANVAGVAFAWSAKADLVVPTKRAAVALSE